LLKCPVRDALITLDGEEGAYRNRTIAKAPLAFFVEEVTRVLIDYRPTASRACIREANRIMP
jgi:hypothetical protein